MGATGAYAANLHTGYEAGDITDFQVIQFKNPQYKIVIARDAEGGVEKAFAEVYRSFEYQGGVRGGPATKEFAFAKGAAGPVAHNIALLVDEYQVAKGAAAARLFDGFYHSLYWVGVGKYIVGVQKCD